MIDPDDYITEYYLNNFAELQKPPCNRFTNINYSKLPADRRTLNISLDIMISENLKIKEVVEWRLDDLDRSPFKFAEELVKGLNGVMESEEIVKTNLVSIPNQIRDQIIFHLEEYSFSSRLRLVKNDIEIPTLSYLCGNCGTYKFNSEICVNCLYIYEKKAIYSYENNSLVGNINLQLLETNQLANDKITDKDLLISDIKEKKTCSKCGEINNLIANRCNKCGNKFSLNEMLSLKKNEYFSINFWEKILKHTIITQLNNFEDKFCIQDFSSTKYLYYKILHVIKKHYKNLLNESAYKEVAEYLNKMYKLFTMNSQTVEKVFTNSYNDRFGKLKINANTNSNSFNNLNLNNSQIASLANTNQFGQGIKLNFNDLKGMVEGYLPENYYNKCKESKVKVSSNTEVNVTDKTKEKGHASLHLIRKRGRPKKIDIFKAEDEEDVVRGVAVEDRLSLYLNKINPPPFFHYTFCGKCFESTNSS